MKQFKVLCQVGNQSDYALFIKADDEKEAEIKAKHYFILDNPYLDFYHVNKVIAI